MSVLAIAWEPELRGLLTVIIGVVILMGSVYLILMTNMGTRLGFLVLVTALAGWMMLMGFAWAVYGIGLKGRDPAWKGVPGAAVLQDTQAITDSGALDSIPPIPPDATPQESADIVHQAFLDQGWTTIPKSEPEFGQAQASAGELLVAEGAFSTGQFEIVEVFDTGGDRFPKINDTLDFLAFFHSPHYVVAEAAPYEPVRTEPGRAPAANIIDSTQPRQYVYMIRDLGSIRQPGFVLMIGGGMMFFALCYLLHRRERILRQNLAEPLPPATAAAPPPPSSSSSADDREKVGAGV